MAIVDGGEILSLAEMPYGGIMALDSVEEVAERMEDLVGAARSLGCPFTEPFTTLSFMALPVIPSLKITDRGLVDVENLKIIDPILSILERG